MFKDKFREANDNIHADDELINKVLALKNPENRITRRKKRFVTYIPAAAAAVLLVSAAAASIPFISKTNNSDVIISESTITDDSAASNKRAASSNAAKDRSKKNTPPEPNESAGTVDAADRGSTPKQSSTPKQDSAPKQSSTPKQDSSSKQSSTPKQSSSPKQENTPAQSNATASADRADNRESAPVIPSAEYELPSATEAYSIDLPDSAERPENADASDSQQPARMNTIPEERVVLSMNSGGYEPALKGTAAASAALSLSGEVSFIEWTYGDYFDYLGKVLNPILPADLVLKGHKTSSITDKAFLEECFEIGINEYGTPVFDNKIFIFEGHSGRYVGIQTSRDTNAAMAYMTDSRYSLSKIGSIYAVLIGTTDSCRGYMISDGISYTITANGLNEDELKELLLSLAL